MSDTPVNNQKNDKLRESLIEEEKNLNENDLLKVNDSNNDSNEETQDKNDDEYDNIDNNKSIPNMVCSIIIRTGKVWICLLRVNNQIIF